MKKIVSLLVLLSFVLAPSLFACTDFLVKAKDGSVVVGRSMEFPIDLKSDACIVPSGTKYTIKNSKGNEVFSWTTKYGFVGINGFNVEDCFVDGFNEKGLSIDGLMFTGAQYQGETSGKMVPFNKLGAWALGSFATVDEVKAAIKDIAVTDSDAKKFKGMGLHVGFHDATGKSIVVEFIGGKANIYDNPLGVMTNRPDFPWQMNNLRNYVNLDSTDKKPKMLNGVKIEPTGVGSGMLGLPGDFTPPSRFVRVAYCLDASLKPKNAQEAINLAEHLLNVVDIPRGVIKEPTAIPFVDMYGYAQWVVIKDLTNKVLYFKTYENTAWKSLDLKKVDLKQGAPRKVIPIDSKDMVVIDVTGNLK